MIADVSLRLLSLIFNGLLNWLTLLSPRILWMPRIVSRPLIRPSR